MHSWWTRRFVIGGVVLTGAACGSSEEIASLPIADAGPDRLNVRANESVVLDGSGSFDPDGGALAYLWSLSAKPAGSTTILVANAEPERTSLSPDVEGYYVVSLRVSNGERISAPDVVAVEVANQPPVAVAECRGGCEALHGAEVDLVGNASEDPDGDPLTYWWRQITDGAECTTACPALACSPSATPVVSWLDADKKVATVVLPALAAEQFVFELAVSDGLFTATDCVAYTTTNTSPVFTGAPAVIPINPVEGTSFAVICFPFDADGDDLTIAWTQQAPVSPQAELTNSDQTTVTVRVPAGAIDVATDFQFEVVIDDGFTSVAASTTAFPVPVINVANVP